MHPKIKDAYRELIGLVQSKTARDAGFVFAGNLTGQAIGFVATLLLIRELGPARFGLFSTAIAVMGLASQFSDLGISTGFVRYASLYLKEDQCKADLLFKITLYLKLGIGFLVLLLGLLIVRPLAVQVFHDPELVPLLRLAFLGSLGATLWGYLQAILQAKEWFVRYAWINVFNNSLKLAGIAYFFYFQVLSETNALLIMALVPFAGFFIDGLLVPKGFLKIRASRDEVQEVFGELFHFSKWVTLATLCTMFLMRLDVFMLQSLATSGEVGIYNSANQLARIFPLVTAAMTISLLPKVSSYRSREELQGYVVKVVKLVPFVLVLVVVAMLLSGPAITFMFGAKYFSAIPIFQVLLIAFAISVILNPISLVLYSINKANVLAYINIVQLLAAFPLNLVLIPAFGGVGAAWSSLAIRVFSLLCVVFLLRRYMKVMPHESS